VADVKVLITKTARQAFKKAASIEMKNSIKPVKHKTVSVDRLLLTAIPVTRE